MPISINIAASTTKSWALEITATAAGLELAAGSVLFMGEQFDIPAMAIPCVYDGEAARYRLALCRHADGPTVVLLEEDTGIPAGYDQVIYLARWALNSAADTCDTVLVEVPQRVLVPAYDEEGNEIPLPEPVVYAVAAAPVLPSATPERTAGRRLRRRIQQLRQQCRDMRDQGLTYSAMTAAQRNIVNELVALTGEPAPLAVPA